MKQQVRKASDIYNQPVNQTISEHQKKLQKALDLQEIINNAKVEQEEIKMYFLDVLSGNIAKALHFPNGSVQLQTANSYSVRPEKVNDLKKIFKGTYDVMVNEKVSFSPTAALKKLTAQGDFPDIDTIREAVVITTNNSIKFTAVKA